MLFKFTVKAPRGLKGIDRLYAKLGNKEALNKVVGIGFEKTLQTHFKTLDKRDNKRGWRKLHFWRGIAIDTHFSSANENGAVVNIGGLSGRKFAAKVRGATIKPKSGKKFLAIPAVERRYGVMPSALNKNELTFRKTRKGGLLGKIQSDGTFQVHYFLVKSANIRPQNDALPKQNAISYDVKKSISKYLKSK